MNPPLHGAERSLHAIHEVARRLSETVDNTQSLGEVLRVAAETVAAAGGAIWEHNSVEATLVCRYAFGEKAAEMTGFVLRDDEGIAGRCFQTGHIRDDKEVYLSPDYARRVDETNNFRTDNLLTLPLLFPGGTPVGVIQLVNKRESRFNAEDRDLLESIASVTAMSLHVAELARMAARTVALDYVGHFAHDIYNRLSSSYSGVPTFRMGVEALAKEWDAAYPTLHAADQIEKLAAEFLEPIEADAALIQRYTRLIARLVKTGAQIDAHFTAQDAAALVRRQVSNLGLLAREHNVVVTLCAEGHDGDGQVRAEIDEILFGSAVYNLINNAIPETRDGSVTVTVRRVTPENCLEVHVSDKGRGMTPEILHSILSGNPLSTRQTGTGLGTLIVKRVAERHGGTLHGESAIGAGTTFVIRVPLSQSTPLVKSPLPSGGV